MLDPRWRKVLRDLWLHRSRSLLVISAVAVGLIGAGAILNTWALVQRATVLGYHASLPVSATLTVDRIDAALIAQVRALPEIAAVRARRSVSAAVQTNAAWQRAVLYAIDDFENPSIARLQPDLGAWPPRDGGLVIERSSLEFSGAAMTETVAVKLGDAEPRTLGVDGIVRDVSLAPGWMEHMVYAYVTTATMTDLGAAAGFNELQIRVKDARASRAAVRRIAYAVKAGIERDGGIVSNVEVPEPGQHIHAAQMNSLLMTQAVFGLLTLVVCAFLVVNLITAMLAGQSREIGVMKTLGASSADIATMYFSMALLLGLMASAISLPAAMLIGREYASFKAEMLNFPITGYAIPWWAIALQLTVGCLLPVAAAAIPVTRACRVSVGAALRDIGIVAHSSGLHTRRRIRVGGISRPLLLSIGNAFRRRQRMLLTLLALAIGGAVFLGAANLRESVRGSVDLMFSHQRYDFTLRFADSQPAAAVETLARSLEGVANAEAWRGARAAIAQADGTESDVFPLIALPPDSTMIRPVLDSGRWLAAADGNALVISRILLRNMPDLKPGAKVMLALAGKPSPWTIVGVIDMGTQSSAYAPRAAIDALHRDRNASSLAVTTTSRSTAMQLDTVLRLRATYADAGMPVASSQMRTENRRVIEDHLLMVVDFLGVMAWVMIVVGGMGLASTMSLSVLERTREIGVLRAIGARHSAIIAIIQTEGMVIAILSWLLSLPLSIPMSVVLANAFGRVMFSVPVHYLPDAGAALRWLALVVGVSLIACAWPARRATHVPTAAALSYE
jgi:putative ABC transport system permease protein